MSGIYETAREIESGAEYTIYSAVHGYKDFRIETGENIYDSENLLRILLSGGIMKLKIYVFDSNGNRLNPFSMQPGNDSKFQDYTTFFSSYVSCSGSEVLQQLNGEISYKVPKNNVCYIRFEHDYTSVEDDAKSLALKVIIKENTVWV